MEVQTLGSLKEQNAKEAGDEAEETAESGEVEEVETEAEAELEAVEDTEEGEAETEGDEESPEAEQSEAWMASEEQDSEGDQPRMFSASEIAIARRKERKKREQAEAEAARLREENAQLRQGTATEAAPRAHSFSKPRPKRDDFPFGDDSAYEAALDAWHDERLDARLASVEQNRQQQQAASAETRAISDAVQRHDERAAELVKKGAIKADAFVQADAKVREALEQATPGLGDAVADRLIAQIGDGSEKLFAYLGRNPTALNVLQGKMVADPTGLQAMLYLGELKAEKVATMRQKSSAPKPGKKLKGDVAGGSAGALQRKYNAAKDAGERIRLKRQAKASGVDTSNW